MRQDRIVGKERWGLGKEGGGLGKECILWQNANLGGQKKIHHVGV